MNLLVSRFGEISSASACCDPAATCRPFDRHTLASRSAVATLLTAPSAMRYCSSSSGRLAQRESASFTPKRSLVRSQYRPRVGPPGLRSRNVPPRRSVVFYWGLAPSVFGGLRPPSPLLLSPGGTTPRTPRGGLRPQNLSPVVDEPRSPSPSLLSPGGGNPRVSRPLRADLFSSKSIDISGTRSRQLP